VITPTERNIWHYLFIVAADIKTLINSLRKSTMVQLKNVEKKAKHAQEAAQRLAGVSSQIKNRALRAVNAELKAQKSRIMTSNSRDVKAAQESSLTDPLLKRLIFSEGKFREMVAGVRDVAKLTDPVGKTLSCTRLDDGLELYQVTFPIGVIGAVFESRPDALVQIACLCLKSGNAVLLKGGSEARYSNRTLTEVIQHAILQTDPIFQDAVQLLETREEIQSLLAMDRYVNLLIPRGSNQFVQYIKEHTKIPVLGHTDGICHIYVDREADIDMAVDICFDAKCQYPAVCNAMETLLVHEDAAKNFLPEMAKIFQNAGVELRGCPETRKNLHNIKKATAKDWETEYLDLVLSIKVVSSLEEAVSHINRFSSQHTDAIVTKDAAAAKKFLKEVDSATVMHNCSTRFADGFRFGMGAEVGISTNKIHARGPVGLEGLIIYKYILKGSGQVVKLYTGENPRRFIHKQLRKKYK